MRSIIVASIVAGVGLYEFSNEKDRR